MLEIRGNVETRLRKLDGGEYDAIVLAVAGLSRLELGNRVSFELRPPLLYPAVGQGAIGLECLDNEASIRAVRRLNDPATWAQVTAERAMLWALGGGCLVPVGVTSKVEDGLLTVRGVVLSADGVRRVAATPR